MKHSLGTIKYKLALASFTVFNAFSALAQTEGGSEGGSSVAVSKTTTTSSSSVGTDWYTEPWALILGVVVFILLLAAIIGGSRGRSTAGRTNVSKTTVTKTDYTGTDA